jgi:type IV pilus biogenesis protein CpaD/CtpE
MRKIVLLAAILAALAGCAARPSGQEAPAWERNDPARRVYGGGG